MLSPGIATMAKKQARVTPKGRPKSEEGPTKQILTLRGREDYKEWLVEFAEAAGSQLAELVADALAEKAKRDGFRNPPRRR